MTTQNCCNQKTNVIACNGAEPYKRGAAVAIEPSKQFCLCHPTSVFISLTFLEDGYRRFYLSSVHGILQARILEWVAIPFSRGSSRPRDQTWVSWTAGRFFTVWAVREAPLHFTGEIKCVLPPGLLFSSLLLCNKPSPNLRPKQHIYFAHKSALWADLHGEDSSLIHLVQAGVA